MATALDSQSSTLFLISLPSGARPGNLPRPGSTIETGHNLPQGVGQMVSEVEILHLVSKPAFSVVSGCRCVFRPGNRQDCWMAHTTRTIEVPMAKFKPQYRRLLFIDKKLKERSYPNCNSIGAEWEVTPKTIQRDLDYMKYELDAPIEYDQTRHGYYYSENNFSLPAINISESDLFAICIAEKALGQFRNTPIHRKLASVFNKIQNSLPDRVSVHPSWLDDRIFCFPEPVTRGDTRIWDVLARAIRDNKRLQIRHIPPDGATPTSRKVDPYYLVNYKGEWYLSSFCHTRNSIRTFAISRVKEARILEETFTMPRSLTREKMFGDMFGIIWKSRSHNVKIRFSPEVAPYIKERDWHPMQRIRSTSNGGAILEFRTNHINEVKDWVLSWGAGATALSPKALVDKVRASLKSALASY
ncbi:MAG: hypothetical protein C0404_09945 [Verrucomicrobia bacterium]|nr:hypothetical protein [Verrucomicrobiota bacterium]